MYSLLCHTHWCAHHTEWRRKTSKETYTYWKRRINKDAFTLVFYALMHTSHWVTTENVKRDRCIWKETEIKDIYIYIYWCTYTLSDDQKCQKRPINMKRSLTNRRIYSQYSPTCTQRWGVRKSMPKETYVYEKRPIKETNWIATPTQAHTLLRYEEKHVKRDLYMRKKTYERDEVNRNIHQRTHNAEVWKKDFKRDLNQKRSPPIVRNYKYVKRNLFESKETYKRDQL